MLRPLSVGTLGLAGVAAAALAVVQPAALKQRSMDAGFPTVHSTQARISLGEQEGRNAVRAGLLPEGAKSVLNLPTKLRYGSWVWNESDVPEGDLTIFVDLRRQLLSAFRGGHEIGTTVILYGAEAFGTPLGRFGVLAKMKDHRSATYDAAMPYTLRLTDDGVSIHGSDVRGGRATHGCIGVPLGFAQRLFDEARVGTSVQIVRSQP